MDKVLWFQTICKKNKFDVSATQVELLKKFCEELLSWNKKINLISRRDEENIWTRHIVGSISFMFNYKLKQHSKVLDVGTGGGLPGIPIAILKPDFYLVLVDSIQKKIKAVNEIISKLCLKNVQTCCDRVENLDRDPKYLQSFDYIIARAVGPTADVLKRCKKLMKPIHAHSNDMKKEIEQNRIILPGAIMLLKGGELTREIEDATLKHKPRYISSLELTVEGVDRSELHEKKLIVVYP